jgi:hypothetical protein
MLSARPETLSSNDVVIGCLWLLMDASGSGTATTGRSAGHTFNSPSSGATQRWLSISLAMARCRHDFSLNDGCG